MIAALVLIQLLLLGANVWLPWRLADAPGQRRQAFRLAVLPALLFSAIVALLHLSLRADAALTWSLTWPPATTFSRILLVSVAAAGAVATLLAVGGRRLEPAGWRLAAGVALLLAATSAVAGEMLRAGGGPAGTYATFGVAATSRLAVTLAAGETLTGRPRIWSGLAAAALVLGFVVAPSPLRHAAGPDLWTLGAAVTLFVLAPLLPTRAARLARPAALAGVALAAVYFARTAELSAVLEHPEQIPDILFPEP
ncbi:MAG: hypothetical protein AB7G12_00145 [Thermoanaerobaculia bacterium]